MKTAAYVVALVFILTGAAGAQDTAFRLDQIESRVRSIEGNMKDVERMTKEEAGAGALALFLFGTVCALWAQNNGRSGLLWFILGFVFSVITAILVMALNSSARAKERRAAAELAQGIGGA